MRIFAALRLLAAHAAGARLIVVLVALCGAAAHGAQAVRGDSAAPADPPGLIDDIRAAARPLTGSPRDYDPLIALIGDARVVMLGESTHGSREFYRERARITQRLIEEKGFSAVVLEAGWPAVSQVNDYVLGRTGDASAGQALSAIVRFPRWTWRNRDFLDFVETLRRHNDARPSGSARVGIYGMDLYGAPEAAQAVIRYLEGADPKAAQRARSRYRCFLRYSGEPEFYGRDVDAGKIRPCAKQAQLQFSEMERRIARFTRANALRADSELFSARQNARLVKSSEAYYRALYGTRHSSWNLRDRHMAEMLELLMQHLDSPGSARAKVVVWAHNSHVGDARWTDQGAGGELNVGQLMRERHGENAVLVGFTTYTGTVRAAPEWGGADEVKDVLPALPGSVPALFHESGIPGFLLLFRGEKSLSKALDEGRLDRVIGVTYLPQTERDSHYHGVRLSRQFDAVVHLDSTRALEPLD